MSRDRRIITRKQSKLTIAAVAGTLTVVTAASAAAAVWPPGVPSSSASSAGWAFATLNRPVDRPADHEPPVREANLAVAHFRAAAGRQAQQAAAGQAPSSATPASSPQAAPSPSPAASASPESIAQSMLKSFGWSSSQYSCLEPLWAHESSWKVTASNPSTGAYGIPQAVPGSKMASAGPDWESNASTQIKWGLRYIKNTYGSPCAAWSHEQRDGWY